MTLLDAQLGKTYFVDKIDAEDDELVDFLFTLGCYSGQPIVAVSKISDSYVVAIRDGRYNMDKYLADHILISG